VARSVYEEKRNPYRVCWENARKMSHGKSRRGWNGNIEIDIIDADCEGMDCIELAEDRDSWRAVVNTVMTI